MSEVIDNTKPGTDGKVVTLSGKPRCETYEPGDGAPCPIDPKTGMHIDYWVLSEEERKKGFVRPLRRKYIHVGLAAPTNQLRELTTEEYERYDRFGYIKFEEYQKSDDPNITGRYWTQSDLDKINKGCGVVTTMGLALCETYARDPTFYGSTFCCGCSKHFPVAEFTWDDGQRVGS